MSSLHGREGLAVIPKPAPPRDSWWTKPTSREEFSEAWQQEVPRMRGSKLSAPTPDKSGLSAGALTDWRMRKKDGYSNDV